jgi:hypothetical protein
MADMLTTDPRPLGPFQDLWQVWTESPDVKLEQDIGHLRRALEVQVDELEAQLYAGNTRAAAAEALGCVTSVLNLLCRMGYTPHQIAEIARDRR